ncbi:MAG: hypothetical protein WC813_01390 [Patescibacteria group bacterium]
MRGDFFRVTIICSKINTEGAMKILDLKLGDLFYCVENASMTARGRQGGAELLKERTFLVIRSPYSEHVGMGEMAMLVEIVPVEVSNEPPVVVHQAEVLILETVGYTNPEVRKLGQLRMAFIH